MKTYYDYITERLTSIVYHFTNFNNLLNILKTDEFVTTSVLGSGADYDVNKGKFFFFSTTRSRNQGYVNGDVKLVLNGDLLNRRYSGVAMDYWGYDFRKAGTRQEMEDRLITDESTIPNATKYILEIHILNDKKHSYIPSKQKISELWIACKRANIPLYFYDERKYFNHQFKEKSIPVDKIMTDESPDYVSPKRPSMYYGMRIATLLSWNSAINKHIILDKLQPDLETYDRFVKSIDDLTYRVKHSWDLDYMVAELTRVYEAEVHNNRASTDSGTRFLLKMLADDLRKLKVTNIGDYIKKKSEIKMGND